MNAQQAHNFTVAQQFDATEYVVRIVEGVVIYEELDGIQLDLGL